MRTLGLALVVVLALLLAGCGSEGPDLPGGDSGKDVLTDHHWLDSKDRVRFSESSPADDVQAAICAYLFGTPDEVGDAAGLDGKVSLHEDSGYRSAGGNGIGFECGYDVKGKTRFAMVVWSRDVGSTGKASHEVTVKLHDGLFGYSAYEAGYGGDAISQARARSWLKAAGARAQGSQA
jgi:predicted small lipoprotein YifL